MARMVTIGSCEPSRCSAYSEDLRWRIVYQCLGLDLSCRKVASNLGVDPSTVSRVVKRFQRTGSVAKEKYNSSTLPRKLTDSVQFLILQLVIERPGIFLHEIQTEVEHVLKLKLGLSTICQFLYEQGFSRQRIQLVARQRDEMLREIFASEVTIYNSDMLIFLDETGCDRRDVLRRYAYSWRGKPAKAHRLLVRGEHISAIAFMSTRGVLDCNVVHGSVNGEQFYKIIQKTLLPHLMPFNGTNPHSIVVMDNASIHHVEGVKEMINEVGALLLYLPPYSPDYNPIEELFSKLKYMTKHYEKQSEFQEMDIESILYTALLHITEEDCQHWIADSTIYV